MAIEPRETGRHVTGERHPPAAGPAPVPSVAAQVATMGLVVGTLAFLPCAVLAGLAFWLFRASPEGFVTFGGTLGFFSGLFAWWLLTVVAGAVYAAWVFPWETLPVRTSRGK